ncbi:unnamed protein product [Effrenium voratum]|uniref:CSD domain-containing protein n=1 Tax=Effrenium voratum TaxID=2562239 RepID=A0AA36JQB8_9DINO|nr:unnamed protein product [Effrenium voratum]
MQDDPEWQMVGFCPKNKDPGFGEYVGQVKQILQNGCGFIECNEVKELYDQDAYVHSTVMEQCGLMPGDEVCFNVHVSAAGRPQVSAPCWKKKRGVKRLREPFLQEPQAYGSKGTSWAGKGGAKGSSWPRSVGEMLKARRIDSWASPAMSGCIGQPVKGAGAIPGRAMQLVAAGQGNADEFLIGAVKRVDHAKNFSLIACPETGYDADVYVPHTVASPQAFEVGDAVAFTFTLNLRGLPQALCIYKMVGFASGNLPHFPAHQGRLSRLLPNGSGFVDCPEASAAYGRDVYVHASVVAQCGLQEQDPIAFDVHINKDGNPQVSAPCWLQVSFDSGQAPQSWAPISRLPVPAISAGGKGGGPKVTLSKGGTVRAEAPAGAGPRTWSSAPGAPRTWSLAPRSSPGAPAPNGGSGRDTWGAKASATQVDELDIDWLPEGFHAGRVCLVELDKNVSLVRCPASNFSREVYVHQSVAEPNALSINDVVCFKVHMNRNNLPQASAPFWKRLGADSSDGIVRFGEFQGLIIRDGDTITVDCPEVMQLHGRDAVMPEDVFQLCELVEGNFICFDVTVNHGGDPEVLPPCWICCSSEKWVRDLVSKGHQTEDARRV